MGLPLVDTHAHCDFERFDADRDEVFARARAAGLVQIVNVGVGPEGSRRSVALAKERPGVFATAGIHPHDAHTVGEDDWSVIEDLVRGGGCVGVGECGLDSFKSEGTPAQQEALFRRHIALARETDLPLVVHCRDAYPDLFRILRDEARRGGVRGVMHCFSGGPAEARESLDLGFFVSFSGVLTFPNAPRTREAARVVPLDRTLVETDCPYLAPQPRRGQRNEPAFVAYTAEELARCHGARLDAVAEATTAAARAAFRLPSTVMA